MDDKISNQEIYEQILLTRQEQAALKADLTELKNDTATLRRMAHGVEKKLSELHQLRGKINFIFYVVLILVVLTVLNFVLSFIFMM